MPHTDHPQFATPDDVTAIWRYMDLPKFLSILQTKALFLPSVEVLAEMDRYEGLFTNADLSIDALRYEDIHDEQWPEGKIVSRQEFELMKSFSIRTRAAFKELRKQYYISCWHANETENAAMWSHYSTRGNGIAIQTTIGRIKASLASLEKVHVIISPVQYLDYKRQIIFRDNALRVILAKRHSFRHENEVRFVCWPTGEELAEVQEKSLLQSRGLLLPVDLHALDCRIVVSPQTDDWNREIIEKLVRKYDLNWDVVRSEYDEAPPY